MGRSMERQDLDHFPQEIVQGVFLGSQYAVQDETLEALKITHVLSVIDKEVRSVPPRCLHKRCQLRDEVNEDLGTVLEEALGFIAEALAGQHRILIHCEQGKSRSASVVVAHVMRSQGLVYDDALQLVKEQRIMARPNTTFAAHLQR